jgi:hypothetical protein
MLSAVGVGVWFLVGAAPAHAAILPPLPIPTLPPIVVAPPPVEVGPVHLAPPSVTVSPPPTPSISITQNESPPTTAMPPPPSTPAIHSVTAPASAAPKPAPQINASQTHLVSTPPPAAHHTPIAPRPPTPVVSNTRATGAIVPVPHHAWTQWLGTAARSYGALLLLLLGALALRFFMAAALRSEPVPKRP